MHDVTDLAEETFCTLLQLAPEERAAFLDKACAGNPSLRLTVEHMLSDHARANDFFQNIEPEVDVARLAENFDLETLADRIPETDTEMEKQAGPYRLIEKLGEGGCGAVYLAEQEHPVRRQVALKIIKLGLNTRSLIGRFKAECRALALMDHPGIARVLDAGATEHGRPYFVMELVRGAKITDFCDEHQYDLRQRLELFIKVCQAIQHAHQKGIIHRDIKPSNVLVRLIDGLPVPKVIDFGIAKAVSGERLADVTEFTSRDHFIGTPAYMSPEQAEMNGTDAADTRSDIYSLGVLLYELLTGKTPFEQDDLIRAGLEKMRHTLRERDPNRPSVKLNGLRPDELTRTALCRRSDPARLKLVLKGDLDWIVMKTLEKDRNRRYETVNGLGMDVLRYLNCEPVLARPPSRWYQFKKMVRRNRAVFTSIVAVSLALISGFGTSTWLYFREHEALRQAEKARQTEMLLRRQAEAHAIVARAASLVDKYQLAEADKLIGSLPSSDTAVVGAAVFRPLGDWAAVNGNWHRAAEYYSVLVRLDLYEHPDPATLDYTKYAVALAEMNDRRTYEDFCRETIRQFANTDNPVAAERIVKDSLLFPPSESLLAALSPFAAVAEKSISSNAAPSPESWMIPWRCLSLSLYEYRRGNFDQAFRWGNQCLGFDHEEFNQPRVASVQAIFAMCHYRLGQVDQARSDLAKSRGLIEKRSQTAFVAYDDGHGWWFDWFLGRLLEREAAAMIEGAAPAQK